MEARGKQCSEIQILDQNIYMGEMDYLIYFLKPVLTLFSSEKRETHLSQFRVSGLLAFDNSFYTASSECSEVLL